jgi:hypothetical protein
MVARVRRVGRVGRERGGQLAAFFFGPAGPVAREHYTRRPLGRLAQVTTRPGGGWEGRLGPSRARGGGACEGPESAATEKNTGARRTLACRRVATGKQKKSRAAPDLGRLPALSPHRTTPVRTLMPLRISLKPISSADGMADARGAGGARRAGTTRAARGAATAAGDRADAPAWRRMAWVGMEWVGVFRGEGCGEGGRRARAVRGGCVVSCREENNCEREEGGGACEYRGEKNKNPLLLFLKTTVVVTHTSRPHRPSPPRAAASRPGQQAERAPTGPGAHDVHATATLTPTVPTTPIPASSRQAREKGVGLRRAGA